MTQTTTHTNCLRCGRPLTATASQARGYGRGCAARIRHAHADIAGFQAHQLTAARELIEDGAIVLLRGLVFRTVSADGSELHLTHPATCNCPAGRKATKPCYHSLAARLLLAA